jgi:hypothetical protein
VLNPVNSAKTAISEKAVMACAPSLISAAG